MPTYITRSGIVGPITDHGVSVQASTETERFLTEARLVFADLTGYLVGEQITETDSNITGRIYHLDTATQTMGVIWASGEFVGEKTITGSESSTAKTPTSVTNLLNRTADTPIYTPLLHTHAVSSNGAGDDQTLYLDEGTRWLVIWRVTGGNVTVCNYSSSYPLIPVPIGGFHSFCVDFRLAKVVLQFDAQGTCQVLESKEELP